MHNLITTLITPACLLCAATAAFAMDPDVNRANAISLSADHPNSFLNFAPELPQMRARAAQINTAFGLHVSEIEPGLFFVTDLVYQSAFAITDDGVVVFDAPPSFGDNLRKAIALVAPDQPITHLIMSHGHSDHNGGGYTFADIPDLEVISAAAVADTLAAHPLQGVLTPTRTFADTLVLNIGGLAINLQTADFHAEDVDTLIYLPDQKFLMAIDTITPGEAPFKNFGATADISGYLANFETFLSYDFTHFLSGHVSVLGTRDDVIKSRDYAFDVRDTVYALMPTFNDRMMEALEAVAFENPNLAYRYAMETIRDDCAGQIIDRWQDELSVVDLWADSHCDTIVTFAIMH
ncbi:MBL fold metallo-hydrolase [Yoonia sp. SS1-5]|uniref:MBL fold metallo-hydrolase n=1 Tax=Yoonia rhodophyticola TaxID=3137370 RepID=A0AAN0MAY7_9RHOB